jgi:hypothetical protein
LNRITLKFICFSFTGFFFVAVPNFICLFLFGLFVFSSKKINMYRKVSLPSVFAFSFELLIEVSTSLGG